MTMPLMLRYVEDVQMSAFIWSWISERRWLHIVIWYVTPLPEQVDMVTLIWKFISKFMQKLNLINLFLAQVKNLRGAS